MIRLIQRLAPDGSTLRSTRQDSLRILADIPISPGLFTHTVVSVPPASSSAELTARQPE